MATTPSDGRWSRRAAYAVSAALGLVLLAMAPARFVSEVAVVQARGAIQGAENGALVPIERLRVATVRMAVEAGSSLSASAGDFAGRGRLMLALYEGPVTPAGDAELAAAAAEFRAALSAEPTAAQTWTRLAYAEYARGNFDAAAKAWRLSTVAAPFDPALMASRLESGLALRPFMDVAARDALAEQVTLFWRWNPDGLIELTRRFEAAAVFRPALAIDPEAADEFDRRLARQRGRR